MKKLILVISITLMSLSGLLANNQVNVTANIDKTKDAPVGAKRIDLNGIEMEAFPLDKEVGWTIKEFGPLSVPAKGQTIRMDRKNGLLYRNLIFWEQKKRVRLDSEHVYLADSLIEGYCFRNNYYFMAGDKLDNSQDSRYWGLLPEEFIVGRADYIWLSRHGHKGKIEWKRFMNRIR